MPAFDPHRVYDDGSHDKSIAAARRDLQADYPQSNVFICSRDPPLQMKIGWAVPPANVTELVTASFEIKATTAFVETYGYKYIVFAEGEIVCGPADKTGNTWITHTEPVQKSGDTYKFERHDGKPSLRKETAALPSGESWMDALRKIRPGSTLLSALTIPTTHNSHAVVGTAGCIPVASKSAECQGFDVAAQLAMGVRDFDFRLGDDFTLRHGRVGLPGRLPDVLSVIHAFLDAHPRETVLVGAKWDMEDLNGHRHEEPTDLRQQIENLVFGYPRAYADTALPTLDNTCGKLVLVQEREGDRGISIVGPGFSPQPATATEPRERLWQEARQRLDWILGNTNLTDGQWYGAGFNGYKLDSACDVLKGTWLTPKDFAENINPWLDEYVATHFLTRGTFRLGRINIDFATAEVVRKLIATNFP